MTKKCLKNPEPSTLPAHSSTFYPPEPFFTSLFGHSFSIFFFVIIQHVKPAARNAQQRTQCHLICQVATIRATTSHSHFYKACDACPVPWLRGQHEPLTLTRPCRPGGQAVLIPCFGATVNMWEDDD